jgi:proline iminopeptidase
LLDQRGCGESADCAPEGYTIDRLAQDIEDTRLQFRHQKIALLGHSFGGPVSLSYALRWPENVSALVLVDTTIRGWKEIVSAPQSWPLWARTIRASFKKTPDWVAFTMRYEVANPDKAEEVRALITRPIRYDHARFQRLSSAAIKPLGVRPLLKAGVPVFGIYGKQDGRFLAGARYLRSTGAKVKLIPRAGHMPFIEQPEKFHNALDSFLVGT